MPYGLPKDKGGESLENVTAMESCVKKLKAQGHSESSAIAICKTSLGFTTTKKKKKR